MTPPTPNVRVQSTEFDCGDLFVKRVRGSEGLSKLFELDVDVASTRTDAPLATEMLGASVTLVFLHDDEVVREVHGIVADVHDGMATPGALPRWARADGSSSEGRAFRLRIAPRAHRLSLVETQDIFVERSLIDIFKEKLERFGLTEGIDFELRLSGHYPVREFVVQYKESDLAFLQRLAEHAGIAYHFDQTSGCDKMVWSDHNGAFAFGDQASYRFDPDGNAVTSLESAHHLVPSVFAVQDYNYRTPLVDVTGMHRLANGFGGGVIEYAPHAKTPIEAECIARVRAEASLTARDEHLGRGCAMPFSAGLRFRLDDHPLLERPVDFVLTSVEHDYSAPSFSRDGLATPAVYENRFRAIEANVPFRPRRVTPRPRIFGFLTGLVEPTPDALGARDTLPIIDEEGRYWIRFHFDTAEPGQQKASRPIRMAQSHAGAGYGMHFPLRPGVEVLLAFLDGDPDRPIILGAVPNAVTPSPVVAESALFNRIVSASGVAITIKDS